MAVTVGLAVVAAGCGSSRPISFKAARSAPATTSAPPTSALSSTTTTPTGPGLPVPTSQLGDISFVDLEHGYANLGDNNGVAATVDGGQTWTQLSTDPSDVNNLSFADLQHGFAWKAIYDGGPPGLALFKTGDGGRTWSVISGITEVVAVVPDGASIWVLTRGAALPGGGFNTDLWTSADSGTSWHRATSALPGGANRLSRVGLSTAYTAYGDQVAETTNSGTTWTALSDLTPTCPGLDANYPSAASETFSAAGPRSFWIVCGGQPSAGSEDKTVYRSADGGAQWTLEATTRDYPNPPVGKIPVVGYAFDGTFIAVSDTTAYMALGRYVLIETKDGGRTWTTAVPEEGDSTYLSVINSTNSVARPEGQGFWRTSDGTHWTKVS